MSELVLNPGLKVYPFDGATHEESMLCEVPTSGDRPNRYVIPARFLRAVLARYDPGAAVSGGAGEEVPAEEMERLVTGFFIPKGVLLEPGHDGSQVAPSRRADSYLRLRFRLIPGALVYSLVRSLGRVYEPASVWLVAAAAVLANVYFYAVAASGQALNTSDVAGFQLPAIAVLTMLGSMLHEFGHAGAAARYGCRRLEIGWGMYLHIPVFYTDLSEAWRLSRTQRALIDMGGIYFQAIYGVVLLAAFLGTGSPVYKYAFFFNGLHMAGSMNPVLRMDGYWLISDLFGISNLRQQSARLLRYGAFRLLGGRFGLAPVSWTLDRGSTTFLTVYTVVSLAFWLYLVKVVFFMVGAGTAVALVAVVSGVAAGGAPAGGGLGMVALVVEVLGRALALFGVGLFTYALSRKVVGFMTSLVAVVRGIVRSPRGPRGAAGRALADGSG
jgi:putative peptide zinc metalloprotease protein